VLPVLNARQDGGLRCCIALQLVSDDHARRIAQAFKHLPEEALCGVGVSPGLHQDVENLAVLIDSTSQVVELAIDGEIDFIQMPFVPSLWSAAA